jgi:integrase
VLKGRESRKTPHWFCNDSGATAYSLIEKASNLKLPTPTELSAVWAAYIEKLVQNQVIETNYDLHDLRHTFITKAIRLYKPVDVMHAVGHKNIETTMRYLHDDRTLDDEEFKPESA